MHSGSGKGNLRLRVDDVSSRHRAEKSRENRDRADRPPTSLNATDRTLSFVECSFLRSKTREWLKGRCMPPAWATYRARSTVPIVIKGPTRDYRIHDGLLIPIGSG